MSATSSKEARNPVLCVFPIRLTAKYKPPQVSIHLYCSTTTSRAPWMTRQQAVRTTDDQECWSSHTVALEPVSVNIYIRVQHDDQQLSKQNPSFRCASNNTRLHKLCTWVVFFRYIRSTELISVLHFSAVMEKLTLKPHSKQLRLTPACGYVSIIGIIQNV